MGADAGIRNIVAMVAIGLSAGRLRRLVRAAPGVRCGRLWQIAGLLQGRRAVSGQWRLVLSPGGLCL